MQVGMSPNEAKHFLWVFEQEGGYSLQHAVVMGPGFGQMGDSEKQTFCRADGKVGVQQRGRGAVRPPLRCAAVTARHGDHRTSSYTVTQHHSYRGLAQAGGAWQAAVAQQRAVAGGAHAVTPQRSQAILPPLPAQVQTYCACELSTDSQALLAAFYSDLKAFSSSRQRWRDAGPRGASRSVAWILKDPPDQFAGRSVPARSADRCANQAHSQQAAPAGIHSR